jgi:hypothetical protein
MGCDKEGCNLRGMIILKKRQIITEKRTVFQHKVEHSPDILTIQEVCVLICNFPQRPPPPQLHMRNHGALSEIIQHFINQSYLHQAYHPSILQAFIEQALHHATALGQGIPNNWPVDSDIRCPLFQESLIHMPSMYSPPLIHITAKKCKPTAILSHLGKDRKSVIHEADTPNRLHNWTVCERKH